MTISKEWGHMESLLHRWVACFPTYHEMILLPWWTLWKFHCITLAVVGDGLQVILMLVGVWIEETWKIVIQSDASKGGIRSDLNSKWPRLDITANFRRHPDSANVQPHLENSRNCLRGNPMNSMLLIQFWEFHSRAEPLFYDLKNYLKLNSVRNHFGVFHI